MFVVVFGYDVNHGPLLVAVLVRFVWVNLTDGLSVSVVGCCKVLSGWLWEEQRRWGFVSWRGSFGLVEEIE